MEKFETNIEVFGITKKGILRINNEDSLQIGPYYKKSRLSDTDQYVYVSEDIRYVVFSAIDGMGGGPHGEVAGFYTAEELFLGYMKLTDDLTNDEVSAFMRSSYQSANNRIVRDPSGILGAVGVSCVIDRWQATAKFFWSGDSRGYLYRNQKLLQITQDQTVAALCLRKGYYKKTDARYQYDRRKLIGYIGRDLYCYDFCPLETQWIPLENADRIFLLTDGIYEACKERELQKAINAEDTTIECCKALINVAEQNESSDDLTVVGSAFYIAD